MKKYSEVVCVEIILLEFTDCMAVVSYTLLGTAEVDW